VEKTPFQAALGRGMDAVLEHLFTEAMKVTNLENVDSDESD
jgi:hypothetical protein